MNPGVLFESDTLCHPLLYTAGGEWGGGLKVWLVPAVKMARAVPHTVSTLTHPLGRGTVDGHQVAAPDVPAVQVTRLRTRYLPGNLGNSISLCFKHSCQC